jgi:hypothetical protein
MFSMGCIPIDSGLEGSTVNDSTIVGSGELLDEDLMDTGGEEFSSIDVVDIESVEEQYSTCIESCQSSFDCEMLEGFSLDEDSCIELCDEAKASQFMEEVSLSETHDLFDLMHCVEESAGECQELNVCMATD